MTEKFGHFYGQKYIACGNKMVMTRHATGTKESAVVYLSIYNGTIQQLQPVIIMYAKLAVFFI